MDLPPPRKGKKTLRHHVSLPLVHAPFSKAVVYALTIGVLFFLAYHIYVFKMRSVYILQVPQTCLGPALTIRWYSYLSRKTYAGGWINSVRERTSPIAPTGHTPLSSPRDSGTSIEDRIRDLAEQLGIHPKELANAIKPLISSAKATALNSADNGGSRTLVDIIAESATASNAQGNGFGYGTW